MDKKKIILPGQTPPGTRIIIKNPGDEPITVTTDGSITFDEGAPCPLDAPYEVIRLDENNNPKN